MRFFAGIFFIACLLFGSNSALGEEKVGYDWFWFFYEREAHGTHNIFTVRPFYIRHFDAAKNLQFDASLMPFVFWRYKSENDDRLRVFLGFYDKTDYRHDDGSMDYDRGLFPFVFYGFGRPESEKDKYFLLWPFGGTLRGKLGYEKITAAVFPGFLLFMFFPPAGAFKFWQASLYAVISFLPVYSSWERKGYKAYGVLWPLFMRGAGDGRDDIRIMPFYAHKKKDGWYSRYSFLMLINYSKEFLSSEVRSTFFFFPFFGRKWSSSGSISAWTVLWPFFSYGYDKNAGAVMYNLPWPLVQIGESREPKMKKRIFFPFYGRYSLEKSEMLFITPLFFRLTKKSCAYDSAYYTNCLIIWWHKRDYHTENPEHGRYWRYFKIWPLLSIEYNEKGDYAFNMLSILPFRDKYGYEKLYEPLWSILEYRHFAGGEKRFGIALRTYYQRWGDDFFQSEVPLLFSYKSVDGKVAAVSFLLHMFGYSHEASGRFMRLFWIPFRIGDGEEDFVGELSKRQQADERERWKAEVHLALAEAFSVKGPVPGGFYFSGRIF